MAPTPVKTNRKRVKSLWKQNVRNAKKFSKTNKPGFLCGFCERYVSSLRKNGKISMFLHFEKMAKSLTFIDAGRPQKLSPEQRRQIGMIIKRLTLKGKSGCTYLQRI
jgi:hypothetical protein